MIEEERDSCDWVLKSALGSVPKEYVRISSVEGEECLCSGALPLFRNCEMPFEKKNLEEFGEAHASIPCQIGQLLLWTSKRGLLCGA